MVYLTALFTVSWRYTPNSIMLAILNRLYMVTFLLYLDEIEDNRKIESDLIVFNLNF